LAFNLDLLCIMCLDDLHSSLDVENPHHYKYQVLTSYHFSWSLLMWCLLVFTILYVTAKDSGTAMSQS